MANWPPPFTPHAGDSTRSWPRRPVNASALFEFEGESDVPAPTANREVKVVWTGCPARMRW